MIRIFVLFYSFFNTFAFYFRSRHFWDFFCPATPISIQGDFS